MNDLDAGLHGRLGPVVSDRPSNATEPETPFSPNINQKRKGKKHKSGTRWEWWKLEKKKKKEEARNDMIRSARIITDGSELVLDDPLPKGFHGGLSFRHCTERERERGGEGGCEQRTRKDSQEVQMKSGLRRLKVSSLNFVFKGGREEEDANSNLSTSRTVGSSIRKFLLFCLI